MPASVANLASPIAPTSTAKTAKTAGASSSGGAKGAEGLFGPGVSAPAASTKTDDAKAASADQTNTAANDDTGASPFAEALAAALGMVLPANAIQPAPTAPATGASDGLNADGSKAQAPQTQSAAIATSLLAANTAQTEIAAGASADAAKATDKDQPGPTIALPAQDPAQASAKPADGKTALATAAASAPTVQTAAQPSPPPAPTTPAPATAVAQAAVETPAPAEPEAAQTAPPPAAVQEAAIAAKPTAPLKAPQLAPPSTEKTAAPKAKDVTATSDAAKAEPARPATAKANVETVTEKAVAAADQASPDNTPPTPDKAADPSPLLAAQQAAQAPVASEAPKVTTHTVAHLAAQIVNNVDGKSTRFDVTLNPEGLGKVDVRVEIGAKGDMTAQLSFANADAAAQMQAKAPELQAALQQAGFDPSKTTLSFNSGTGQQAWQDAQQQNQGQPSWTGRAFTNLADQSDEAVITPSWTRPSTGVDVRI